MTAVSALVSFLLPIAFARSAGGYTLEPVPPVSFGALDASCPNVLVAYYSASSAQWTAKLANAVAAGAAGAGANVRLLRTNETACGDLLWADGIALGSPVYWATVSSQAKLFLEQLQTDCFGWPVTKLRNKVGAAFATGGHPDSGKDATMAAIQTAWRAMRMVTVGCDCDGDGVVGGTTCSCNPWGAAATNPDGANQTALVPSEALGGKTLGERIVEVAAIMANKRGCGAPE